jgi:ELWxxDGT repeat protein
MHRGFFSLVHRARRRTFTPLAAALSIALLLFLSRGAVASGPQLAQAKMSPPTLVRDILAGDGDSDPDEMTASGGTLFFSAYDDDHGSELWKSDGTEAGTLLVRDIVTGTTGVWPGQLVDLGGTLFFSAHTDTSQDLWKSDGTEAGTAMVKDLNPDSMSLLSWLTVAGDLLYFVAYDDTYGDELWASDGTEAGTAMVKDIHPDDFLGAQVHQLTAVGDALFFLANDGEHGLELWTSDGTEAGTAMVKDITPGPGGTFPNDEYEDDEFVVFDGALYFRAQDDLWRSDGTPEGTFMVHEVQPYEFCAAGDTLFFRVWGLNGGGLWKSDGTEAGTVLVKELAHTAPWRSSMAASGDTLFFTAYDDAHGSELWVSDGTEAGTMRVKDINPGATCQEEWHIPGLGSYVCNSFPSDITPYETGVVFKAYDGVHGQELWYSDGSEAGTVLVHDLNPLVTCDEEGYPGRGPYPCGSDIGPMTELNGALYFQADDGTHGDELWTLPRPEPPYAIYVPLVQK